MNNYEEEQIKINAEIEAKATSTPLPTPTPVEVVVEKYRYTIEVPKSMTVMGSNVTESEAENDKKTVVIETATPGFEVTVCDEYGNEAVLREGEKLETKTFEMLLLDLFKVDLLKTEKSAGDYVVLEMEHPDYKWCYEFADMPKILKYEFKNALAAPQLKILDNLDKEVEVVWTDGHFKETNPRTLKHIPEDVLSEEEAMQYVKTWSLFLTDDLNATYTFKDKNGNVVPYTPDMKTTGLTYSVKHPSDHGFSVISELLLPETYRYEVLKAYAYGADIRTVSKHKPNPVFSDEKIDNFVMYDKDVFAVDVSFTKAIDLWSATNSKWYARRLDKTSVRVYFVANPDSSAERKWLMADMTTLTEDSETQEDYE
ncbi:MAG: hypothetical protein K6F63_00640 [Lachnospiraceae bacterium]|nr:hypothetical protein [Lachnospiraceae bacterium]